MDHVAIKEVRFIDAYPYILKLNQDHWDEVGGITGQCSLDLDMNAYLAMQAAGTLVTTAAYIKEELIGYMSITKAPHPHHRGKIFAVTDAFYVAPQHRGRLGTRLVKFTEKRLKEEHSVDYFQLVVNANFDVGPWAMRLGFEPSDTIYMKKLED